MNTVEKVKNLFAKYQTTLNSVSQDLKPEIQKEQKFKIKKELGEPLGDAIRELTKEADDLTKVREQYSDPQVMLVYNALNNADKFSAGDAAIAACIKDLPDSLVETLIGHTENPVLQLGLYTRTFENADLRAKVLGRVALPVDDIKQVAVKEVAALQTLAEVGRGLGFRPEAVMEIGYRIKAAEKALA